MNWRAVPLTVLRPCAMKRSPLSLMRAVSLIEPLEDRIAPAALTISGNGKIATYTNSTGDTVQVSTSKGTFFPSQFTFNSAGDLFELNLSSNGTFTGANILFTVIPVVSPGTGGSAMVNVGYFDAQNVSLGSVTIPGDLGHIDVGGGTNPLALGKLTLDSLGTIASSTGTSNILGTVGVIDISGDVDGTIFAQDYHSHASTGVIGQLNIGGSLNGGAASAGPGDVFFTGALGIAVIGGGIEGGLSPYSGSIGGYTTTSGGLGEFSKIGAVIVKGSVPDDPNPSPFPGQVGTSILGGFGAESGAIVAVSVGGVYVAGDVFGGTGVASGAIQSGGPLGSVTIAGSLIGGNFQSGSPGEAMSSGLVSGVNVGSVVIGKNIYGGSGINSGEVLSTGTIHSVSVMGDVFGGSAGNATTPGAAGVISANALGKVLIGGSLIGGNLVNGDVNQTGQGDGGITSATGIGIVYVGKNVLGGSGPSSGVIQTTGGGAGVIYIGGADPIDGSLVGGTGASSGTLLVDGSIGHLNLTHNVTGGSGAGAGAISANGNIGTLTIGGSITGGTADQTGVINVYGGLGNGLIDGGVTGSSSGATKLTNTGYVQANAIGSLVVDGALTSGTAGAGGLDTSGAIRSNSFIGNISVGALIGNSTNPAIISAAGQTNLAANAKSDTAIGHITVTGAGGAFGSQVSTYADILAGYNTNTNSGADPLGTGVSADAQIGSVVIDGNLMATNIIAGVGPGTTGFGTAGGAALSGTGVADLPSIISRISQVVITGTVVPTASTADSYGIAAQYIASAFYDGSAISLVAGPDNDTFPSHDHKLGATGDIFLYEV